MNKLLLIFPFVSLSIIGFANSILNIDSLKTILTQYEVVENNEKIAETLFQIGNYHYNE